MKTIPGIIKNIHQDLDSESNPKDTARVTLSLGLIATYVAVVAIFVIPSTQQTPFVNNIKNILTILWGLPTLELVIFILLEGLNLKYIS